MLGTAIGILNSVSLRNTNGGVVVDYTANSIEPDTVCDFENDYFRENGVDTDFSSMCVFTRNSTATYFDANGIMQTAIANEARYPHYIYNGSEWVNEGLLFELNSNNQVPYSNDPVAGVADGLWAIYRGDSVTLTANDATGPDSNASMTRMTITDTTNEEKGVVIRDNNWPIGWYSLSCFVKDIDQRYVAWWLYAGGNNYALVTYDLQEGVVTQENATGISLGGSGIEDFGNGLYRIWAVMNQDSTTVSEKFGLMFVDSGTPTTNTNGEVAYTGTAGTGIHCGFFQIEPHSRPPSSYIDNPSTTYNTLEAETFYINASDMTYSASAYSFAFNGKLNVSGIGGDTTNYLTGWNNGVDNNNRYLIRWSENTGTHFGGDLPWETQLVAGGTVYTHTPAARPQSGYFTDFNVAWRNTTSELNTSINGSTETAISSGLPSISNSEFPLGSTSGQANGDFNGTMRVIRQWAGDISDGGIVEASSIGINDYTIYMNMQNIDNVLVINESDNEYQPERVGYVSKIEFPETFTNGIWFDGVDDYVRVPVNLGTTLIPVDTAWSVTFEYYPRHTVDASNRTILGAQYNQTGALWDAIRFDFDPSSGAPRFLIAREGQAQELIVPIDGSGNTVHWGGDPGRYTITCDALNNINFYYGNELLGTGSFDSANHPTTRLLDQFEIGATAYGGGGGSTDGVSYGSQIITHLAIYNGTEFTAQEVADLSSGSGVPYTPALEMNFDDNTGSTVTDVSGNNRNGTISGALWMASDIIPDSPIPTSIDSQGALHFNGASDTAESHIQISNTTGLLESGDVSVSLWFWLDPAGLNRRQFLWSTQSGVGTGRGLRIESDNTLQGVANGSSQLLLDTTDYPIGGSKWYHCVFVRERGGTGRLYLDGQEIDSNTLMDDRPSGADLTIGDNTPESTFDRKFQGWIDDFRVYEYALSPADVKDLYNLGTSITIYNLLSTNDVMRWYDPSDTSTMFTGSQGARTQVSANDDPVHIILDKGQQHDWSGELITNGTFDTDTSGWIPGDAASNLSQENGRLRITNGDATAGYAILDNFTPTIGVPYLIKFDIVAASTGTNFRFLFGGTDTSGTLSIGTYIYIITPTTTGNFILSNGNMSTNGAWVEWDNVSLEEIPGIHMQSGPAGTDKPLLKISDGKYWLETGGGADMSNITGDNSSFNFLHDGTGSEFAAAIRPSGSTNPNNLSTIFSTGDWATAEIGSSFGIEDRSGTSNNAWRWFVSSGSSGNPTFNVYTSDTISDTTSNYVIQGYYQEGFNPEYHLNSNQFNIYSGDSTFTPSASNATGAMTFFDRPSKSFGMSPGGRIYNLIFIDRVLRTSEREWVYNYISRKLPD